MKLGNRNFAAPVARCLTHSLWLSVACSGTAVVNFPVDGSAIAAGGTSATTIDASGAGGFAVAIGGTSSQVGSSSQGGTASTGGVAASTGGTTSVGTISNPLPLLHTSTTQIVTSQGTPILLRGMNLGGWLVMEKWMCPLDSGNLPDTYSVIQTLDSRFGVAKEQELIATYQQNWITEADLDNIKSGGYNVVRVPVWWGNFYPLGDVSNASWRADAFERLDWLVEQAGARGIYVIIDMHGAVGGQSTADHTGRQNSNAYWSDGNNQGNTAWMWWQIAHHFVGNPAVAGYDLLNEPSGAPSTNDVWSAYASLYTSVRSADPDHIIIMEGTFGDWNWDMLPAPSVYGWTNVVYEMHEYAWNGDATQVRAGTDKQVNDFASHAAWEVPGYIGEFNDFGVGADTWSYTLSAYEGSNLSWTMWSYKVATGTSPSFWGWYYPVSTPKVPDIQNDSAEAIADAWSQWRTSTAFDINDSIGL